LRQVETLLRRAVTLDRKLAKGFLELGILLSDQQRYKEAIPALQNAARVDPNLAQAHYRLSQAYQRTGQQALADKELEIFERLSNKSSRGGVDIEEVREVRRVRGVLRVLWVRGVLEVL